MQPRPLFDVWEEIEPKNPSCPWRVQLVGYVGQFESRDMAEKYVAIVKKHREKFAKSSTSMLEAH